MTVHTNNILETLSFQELRKENIHDGQVKNGLVLSETLHSQHKFANIAEQLFLSETNQHRGIYIVGIAESLIINQNSQPRVYIATIYEHLLISQFANSRVFLDKLVFVETLVARKSKTVAQTLTLVETLTTKVTKNVVVLEVMNLSLGLSGYAIQENGLAVNIAAPYCAPPPALVFGIIMQETPIGTINSINATFDLTFPPAQVNSLLVYVNGLLQQNGMDYTFAGTTITFNPGSIPHTGDTLLAYYVR